MLTILRILLLWHKGGVEGQRADKLHQNGKLHVDHSCSGVIKGKLCGSDYVVHLMRVAPPMVVGVWSMAVMLWQLFENYHYYW